MKQLIILGNGFDLAAGLKSSYSDFFLDRFKHLFKKESMDIHDLTDLNDDFEQKQTEIMNDLFSAKNDKELSSNIDYFRKFCDKWFHDRTPNRWDIIFLFAKCCIGKDPQSYEWQDVESVIYEVLTIAFDFNSKSENKISYEDRVTFNSQEISGKDAFKIAVNNISSVEKNSVEVRATELLTELKKFESNFASFIKNQIDYNDSKSDYLSKAKEIFENISLSRISENNHKATTEIDVLNFNYSLDERFEEITTRNINSWTNIHGVAFFDDVNSKNAIKSKDEYNFEYQLPAPIFGIDNHNFEDNQSEFDLRILFTKAYRVIENDINRIRISKGYSNVGLITIYGHSLGSADYSYFEAVFDENDLYNSGCRIEYFYYPGESKNNTIIYKKKAITRLYNLLENYGESLDKNHGKNIISKMNLENRLSVVPIKKTNDMVDNNIRIHRYY